MERRSPARACLTWSRTAAGDTVCSGPRCTVLPSMHVLVLYLSELGYDWSRKRYFILRTVFPAARRAVQTRGSNDEWTDSGGDDFLHAIVPPVLIPERKAKRSTGWPAILPALPISLDSAVSRQPRRSSASRQAGSVLDMRMVRILLREAIVDLSRSSSHPPARRPWPVIVSSRRLPRPDTDSCGTVTEWLGGPCSRWISFHSSSLDGRC